MTFIADLSPCNYVSSSEQVLAVGWLGVEHDYAKGDVADEVFMRLVQLLVQPWQPMVAAGRHDCEFCRFSGSSTTLTHDGTTVSYGVSNLFIPGKGVIYAAPSMIVHYIDSHGYAPPSAFCESVMSCPEMRSMEYKKAILKNGPKGFATGHTWRLSPLHDGCGPRVVFNDTLAPTRPIRTAPGFCNHPRWSIKNALHLRLAALDRELEWGMIGTTIPPVLYVDLPVAHDQQLGYQLMITFWAWGNSEAEVMSNLERVLGNLAQAFGESLRMTQPKGSRSSLPTVETPRPD